MTNDEWRITNDERNPKLEGRTTRLSALGGFIIRISVFLRISSFVIRIWKLRFMESPLSLFRMHWDHEPETLKPFRIKVCVFRFMESFVGFAVDWDHEPATGETPPQRCCRHLAGSALHRWFCRQDAGSTLGFMERG